MSGGGKKRSNNGFGKSLHTKNGMKISITKRPKPKPKSHGNTVGSTMSKQKVTDYARKGEKDCSARKNVIQKANQHKRKPSKKQSSLSRQGEKLPIISSKEHGKHVNGDVKSQKLKKRGKRKRAKDIVELDEASRLQRRARYLLIKMKLEQNLIDAYSAEGWKGQSREKIKPEKELQRAKKQILSCKLGIRDAIHQLDLLSSVGRIEDSVISPDGSVFHEHIFCAKCKLREALPDNDIILCDGTCNRAFHQKCLDPPLSTENRDQGWFCKFCDCKMDILEAMNAHLGTHFSVDSNWQDIFKEEAALPDGGDVLLPEQEWPSDDSEDDDYDPEKFENSCSCSRAGSEDDTSDDGSRSISLWSLEGEVFSDSGRSLKKSKGGNSVEPIVGVEYEDITDNEIISGRRQRRSVDYKKLYYEMFGKDAPPNEQISEDEDWGPTRKKRKETESDAASTLMTLSESKKKCPNLNTKEAKTIVSSGQTKKPFFRIPPDAVERLRVVFAENELPSRAVKENLSKQLGLESEKVNKWFKNARYLALKARKAEKVNPFHNFSARIPKECGSGICKGKTADQMASKDMKSAIVLRKPKNFKRFRRRKNPQSMTSPIKKKQHKRALIRSPANGKVAMDFGDDVSLRLLRENAKRKKKRVNFKAGGMQEAEAEMEKLCKIKGRVEKLQQVLLRLPTFRSNRADALTLTEISVIYIPVAELREKR